MRSNPIYSRGPKLRTVHLFVLLVVAIATTSTDGSVSFTPAVIPDTQYHIDFRHRSAEGFESDAADEFVARLDGSAQRFGEPRR